jgi:hypothetical protein
MQVKTVISVVTRPLSPTLGCPGVANTKKYDDEDAAALSCRVPG